VEPDASSKPSPPPESEPPAETKPPTSRTLQAGLDALRNNDYAGALRLLLPEAQQGDDVAAAAVGELYLQGRGVTRDAAEGIRWLSRAAVRNSVAQYSLARAYDVGTEGLAPNSPLSFAWYAAARHNPAINPAAEAAIRRLWKKMTESQQQFAMKLARLPLDQLVAVRGQ
jgi:TPR repeat protein